MNGVTILTRITDKGWEAECRAALGRVPGVYCKSGNSTLPDCDSYGTYRGMSWRCESKQTEKESLPFSALTKNEIAVLEHNRAAGGLSFVMIAQDVGPYERRAWAINYTDLLVMGLGTKAGSVMLEGPNRCPFLVPVPLLPPDWARKGNLPEWWIEPWFRTQFALYLVRELARGATA